MRPFTLVAILAALVLAPTAAAWTWPADGPVLQPFLFDPAHPYAAGQHRGIDVRGAAGSDVRAPIEGVVTFAGAVPASGRSITIETADGLSVTLTHLGTLAVRKGRRVDRRGRRRGHDRALRRARGCDAVRPPRRARDSRVAGLPRPALVLAGASGHPSAPRVSAPRAAASRAAASRASSGADRCGSHSAAGSRGGLRAGGVAALPPQPPRPRCRSNPRRAQVPTRRPSLLPTTAAAPESAASTPPVVAGSARATGLPRSRRSSLRRSPARAPRSSPLRRRPSGGIAPGRHRAPRARPGTRGSRA